ncbi:putative serine esterase-domain-containing protein [Mariannaea sp. PMI_226]|nr:putative serine esterase-domain-containing protein [Mariannaea sp. PMI_226]
MNYAGGSAKADHLCVLVHGLGGKPAHVKNIARSLRAKYPPEQIYLLFAKENRGSLSYDGIERGGERVCFEIEEELKAIENRGGKIKKLSMVGYSLGGLVLRYAIGLLFARGTLDKIECMNFATFATPHLGVRSPTKGCFDHVWNVLGARTLSITGQQLFIIDMFRDTGRPLLAILADPESIFILGLQKFKRRSIYSNIINDIYAAYYTTSINSTDPYIDLNELKVNYIEGFQEVILDPDQPFTPGSKMKDRASFFSINNKSIVKGLKKAFFIMIWPIYFSIGIIAFLTNSAVQTIRSSCRIKVYERGKAGFAIEQYRMPIWPMVSYEVEHVSKGFCNAQKQEGIAALPVNRNRNTKMQLMTEGRRLLIPSERELPLAPHQFEMIDSLNSLKWRKYPVWIKKVSHTHAAIIVSTDKPSFSEGHVVVDHFAGREFII